MHTEELAGMIFGKDTRKGFEFIFVRPSPRIRKDWKVFLAHGSFELQKIENFVNFEPLPKIRFTEECKG